MPDWTAKIMIEIPGRAKKLTFVPAKHIEKLEALMEKYGKSDSISWEELAKDRIVKHGKAKLALRGARYREGLSQKVLAKKTGISQENISKMERDSSVKKLLRNSPKLSVSILNC